MRTQRAGKLAWLFCAWILWHENETSSWSQGTPNRLHWWETPTAYTTKADCEAAQGRVFAYILRKKEEMAAPNPQRKRRAAVTAVPPGLVIYNDSEDSNNSFIVSEKLVCLPDTVNPK